MTTVELRDLFNREFKLEQWPRTYEVDVETYGNVCHSVFTSIHSEIPSYPRIALGPHNGIMFKGIELILKG